MAAGGHSRFWIPLQNNRLLDFWHFEYTLIISRQLVKKFKSY